MGMYIALAVGASAVLLGVTGWWRWAFTPFRIRPSAMTVQRRGLLVSSPASVERVNGVLGSFAGGFNAMIARPSGGAWQRYCDGLPALYQPFAHEGAAMGFTLRRLFRYDAVEFESRLVRARCEFRYLYYVGLGFWSGLRRHSPLRLARVVDGLDPLHRYLCYDGYGFKHAFFDYARDPGGLAPLDRLEGYARHAAYQGVGRAMWFLYLERPDVLIERIRGLGEYAEDAAAGVGLAAVFVNPDRLEVAQELATTLPAEWHGPVHLGMCFGLKARQLNDPDTFHRHLDRVDPGVRQAVGAAIEACDRIEFQVRSDTEPGGYRRWRRLVSEWMADRIDYPLVKVKEPASRERSRQVLSA